MKKESWKESKLHYMSILFGGSTLKKYESEMEDAEFRDDRQVYINIFYQIIKAINSMPKNPNNYVCVAMNHKISEDVQMLKEINLHFIGKEF